MDYDGVREQLLAERARLERELTLTQKELTSPLQDASGESPFGQHLAENASAAIDRELDLTLEENLRKMLAKIDRALQKLDEGSYGICDRCKEPIGRERLEVAPYATLCMRCKKLEERSR